MQERALNQRAWSVASPEGAPVSDRAEFVRFRPDRVNVYADGWRVEGGP